MKLKLISLFVLLAFVLSACAAAVQGAQGVVELPSPLQVAILTFFTFVVGFIFTKVGESIPFLKNILQEYVDEVAMTLAGGVVLGIQNALNAIPPEWEGAANAFLVFLVAVLAAYSLLKTVRGVARVYRASRG